MTEEVTLEDLQKQVLELQKQLEATQTAAEASKKELETTKATLEKARDLNADLMTKVPGGATEKKTEDPYSGMTDDEFLKLAMEKTVDDIAAQSRKKE